MNLAARLEAHTKAAGRGILVDEGTALALALTLALALALALAGRLPLPLQALGPVALKGKAAAVEVHAVGAR